jgi:hypothetical protein
MNFCEYGCGKEATYQFKNGKWCCEKNRESCQKVKENIKLTCMKKYGFAHPLQNKEVQGKMKQTCMKKYGVDNPLKSKEVQEKIKQTCLEKYGVDHNLKSKEIQEKIKQTCLEKYGVDHNLKSKEVQEKRKQTIKEKYGVAHPLQNKEIHKKMKQTNMEKYGDTNYRKSVESKEQFLKRHPFFCQIEEIKIEDNQFKVHCKYSDCINSKENGGWFITTSLEVNNRIGALENRNDGNYFYCSQDCKTNCKAFNVRSDPNRDTESIHAPGDYETFRLHVLTRDNYICQYCGKPATDVHHERPVKLEPFFSLDPCYGWSCCEECHYAKGHKKGTECSTGNLAAKVCSPVKKMLPLKN